MPLSRPVNETRVGNAYAKLSKSGDTVPTHLTNWLFGMMLPGEELRTL